MNMNVPDSLHWKLESTLEAVKAVPRNVLGEQPGLVISNSSSTLSTLPNHSLQKVDVPDHCAVRYHGSVTGSKP